MNQKKIIENSFSITSKILSLCVCLIPAILIFSNSIADIIVVCASLFFIFHSKKNNNWLWLKQPWIKISLVIYFWLIITGFFAYNQEMALSRSFGWIRFIIFAASLQFFFLNNKKNINRLIFFTFVALIYVLMEMSVEKFFDYSLYSELRELFLNADKFGGGPDRLHGPFKDASKSGIFLAYFIFPIIFGLIEKIRNKKPNYILLTLLFFFVFINIYFVYKSGHRASFLSVLISFFVLIFYFYWNRRKIIMFASIIFFAGLFLYSLDSNLKKPSIYHKTVEEIKNYPDSAYGALSITTFKMFKENPIFGIGLKNYRVACERDEFLSKGHLGTAYGVSPWKGHYNQGLKRYYAPTCSSHPHNLYLTWLAEAGLIGLLLFIFLIIAVSKEIFKNKKIISNKIITLGILLSLFPKLLPMMPSLNFFSNWNAICFWFLIGWLLSFFQKKNLKNL